MRRLDLVLLLLLCSACGADGLQHERPYGRVCNRVYERSEDADDLVIQAVRWAGFAPVQGVRVEVVGQETALTDAEGNATFALPTEPYTLRVHYIATSRPSEPEPYRSDQVRVIGALTGNRIVVCVPGKSEELLSSSWIDGELRGRSEGGAVLAAVLDQKFGERYLKVGGTETAETFSVQSRWAGPSRDVTVRAFDIDFSDRTLGPIGRYLGYGAERVSVKDQRSGGRRGGVHLEIEPIEETRVRGRVTSALPEIRAELSLDFVDGTVDMLAAELSGPASDYDFPAPLIDDARLRLSFYTSDRQRFTRRSSIVSLPEATDIDLPAPVELLSPTEGATIAQSSAVFSWTSAPAGATYGLSVWCEWMEGGFHRWMYYRDLETMETQASLPALPNTAIGSGAVCTWSVHWTYLDPDDDLRATSVTRTFVTE